jgi:signal transduction histidine kinase
MVPGGPARVLVTSTPPEVEVAANEPPHAQLGAAVQRARQVVHDLRNPIGSIQMAVQMLRDPLLGATKDLPPERASLVQTALDAIVCSAAQLQHLVGTLEDLPAVPRAPVRPAATSVPVPAPQAAKPRLVRPPKRQRKEAADLDEILRRVELLAATRSNVAALVRVHAPPGLRIIASGPEVLRALTNLVENAVDAAAAARPGHAPWTVDVLAVLEGPCVCIEIWDDGAGVPQDVADFLEGRRDEAPASAKTGPGAHGIGTGVVRRIAEENGGSLRVGREGGRTVVRLRIPAGETAAVI